MSRADFRPFVPSPGQSKITDQLPRVHAEGRMTRPRTQEMFGGWAKLAAQPFTGVTTNGNIRPGLFAMQPSNAPVDAMATAAARLLSLCSQDEQVRLCQPLQSDLWRQWQNTELYVEHHGLRLDAVSEQVCAAALDVIGASLSPTGYATTRSVMRLNQFLGQLVGAPQVLGEWAYLFVLFGMPDPIRPWGWQLFGHHLSLNCVVVDRQMVLSPTFLGAEPNYADAGPHAGLSLFEDEEREGLALMRSFTGGQQAQALLSASMGGDGLPPGRRHFADGLHLGGAAQDNRIIPYEGLKVAGMDGPQRHRLMELIGRYVAPLPSGPLETRMAEIERHLAETHFCWIGGTAEHSPFYYRIQSPVLLVEFDHHGGVFLTNTEPAKFHVHTIVRTPNGNDYGVDLLRQHYETAHHHGPTARSK